jgi:glc operon protein GlcG
MATVRTRRTIDEAGAEAVLEVAERLATKKGYRVVIAVVEPSGELVALRRTKDAQVASSRVAVDKARTAAIFIRPSREIEEQVSEGRLGALALHGARALTGGIPLVADGEVVGAAGTSGETPDEDESVSIATAEAEFSTVEVPALTYDGARAVAEAVGAEASRRGVAPVVSVVDSGGDLIYLLRPDAAQVASVNVTTDKARTAAIYRRPSKDFEDQAAGGRPSALHLARAVPLQGGMPITHDGQVIGAVGVSGASSADEDQELATIGVPRRAPPRPPRTGAETAPSSSTPEAFVRSSSGAGCSSTPMATSSTPGAARPRARSITTSTRSTSCTSSTATRP